LLTTQLLTIDGEVAERYWKAYDDAFECLRAVSPCRQYLAEAEFHDEMKDERIIKFVLWDGDDPVAMMLVASDLRAIPWISPEYFAERYPEHYAEGRIYYAGALLTVPHERRMGNANRLLVEVASFIAERQAVMAFDCAGVNDEFLPALIRRVADEVGEYREDKLDAQHYYAIEAFSLHRRGRRFVRGASPAVATGM
jgi:hypothetical protein